MRMTSLHDTPDTPGADLAPDPSRRRLTGAALGGAALLLLPGLALRPAWAATSPGEALAAALATAMAGPGGTANAAHAANAASSATGRVLMLRHALAPGTFDPPGFRLGDCSTQRNLDDEGRRQAREIGAWMAERRLRPTRVRSSPWCRCVDTAQLAFAGDPAVDVWPALGSPHAGDAAANARALDDLRKGLREAMQRASGFEVWVTHNFVFSDFLGASADVGAGVLLGLDAQGAPQVRLRVGGDTFARTAGVGRG